MTQQISRRFTPRMLKKIHEPIEKIGREIVEKLYERGDTGECDFVEEVSAPLPIAVIAWLLGVPESDWKMLFDWTNRMTGVDDSDFNTTPQQAAEAFREVFEFGRRLRGFAVCAG